jgi:hypothetical protein
MEAAPTASDLQMALEDRVEGGAWPKYWRFLDRLKVRICLLGFDTNANLSVHHP